MNKNPLISSSLTLLLMSMSIYSSTSIASAQITPDNTLGEENSQVKQINQFKSLIEGGAIRGDNLFHSFLEFNINKGQSAYFTNPDAINNILGRITGNNISKILGTLGVNGNANLFLLNPHGFIFGENAQLDLNGSFTLTTGEINLGENGVFNLTNIPQGSLLNIKPEAVFSNLSGKIENQANLVVKDGQNLILMANEVVNQGSLLSYGNLSVFGNNLQITGTLASQGNLTIKAQDAVTIRDSKTEVFQGISGNDLLIQGNQTVDIFALNNADSGLFAGGNLILRSANSIVGDAHYWSGGNFRVEQLDSSLGRLESLVDPIIRTTGDVFIDAYQGTSLHIIAGGKVEIPNFIWITGADGEFGLQETITLSDGQQILIDGKNKATVDIRAGVSTEFIGEPFIEGDLIANTFFSPLDFSDNPSNADINLGTIIFRDAEDINQKITGDVFVTNQYQPNPDLTGSINLNASLTNIGAIDTGSILGGGRVIVDSRGDINLTGSILANSNSVGGDIVLNSLGKVQLQNSTEINVRSGDGGSVTINGLNVELRDESKIRAGINEAIGSPDAQGGDINLNAQENIILSHNSFIANTVRSESSQGNAGDININSNSLVLNDSATLNVSTFGQGNAGNIKINATESVFLNGLAENIVFPAMFATVAASAQGQGGNIAIDTSEFKANFALISSITQGLGEGGDIVINADKISITDESFLQTDSLARGNSGLVQLNATESIEILDNSFIFSQVREGGIGNSGGIEINAGNLSVKGLSSLSTSNSGEGNAGNVSIGAEDSVVFELSSFLNTGNRGIKGNGGNINITAESLSLIDTAFLITSSDTEGNSGDIKINLTGNLQTNATQPEQVGGGILTTLEPNGIGRGGDVEIQAHQILISDNSLVETDNRGQGNAGKITITANDSITISNQSQLNSVIASTGNGGTISLEAQGDINLLNNSSILSSIESGGVGKGGNVDIQGGNLTLADGSQILTIVREASETLPAGQGIGGDINIQVEDTINLTGRVVEELSSRIVSDLGVGATGKAGNIKLEAGTVRLNDTTNISTQTNGFGDAGNIDINARNLVSVDGSLVEDNGITLSTAILSSVGTMGEGNAGNISINTDILSISNQAELQTFTSGTGNAGNVDIQALSEVSLENAGRIFSSVNTNAQGNAGDVSINASRLNVMEGSRIDASTQGQGNGGKIQLNTIGAVNIVGESSQGDRSSIVSQVESTGVGNGQDILINAAVLNLSEGGAISASTEGLGNAGTIRINASDSVIISGESSDGSISSILTNVLETGVGNGGEIVINTSNLNLADGGIISAGTSGVGNAGAININASNGISLSGQSSQGQSSIIQSQLEPTATGNSEDINIETMTFSINDGGIIFTTASGNGNAGNIFIVANDSVTIAGTFSDETLNRQIGGILAFTLTSGKAGNIDIATPEFILQEGAGVEAFTEGEGDAGNITINAPQLVNIGNEGKIIVETSAQGQPGNIEINTNTLNIGQDARLSATATATATNQEGEGSITLKAENLSISGTLGIFAETQGDTPAGNITIEPDRHNSDLNIRFFDDGFISARTTSISDGGSITINSSEVINISGQGSITVETFGSGKAGNININTEKLNITESTKITASTSAGGKGGNINLRGQQITLKNGLLSTETEGIGNAGEIEIKTQNLSLQQGSEITSASQNQGNGDRIFINASQSIIVDDSELSAETSGTGNAGDVELNTQRLILQNQGEITTATEGKGEGGDIIIKASESVTVNQSTLFANTLSDDIVLIGIRDTGDAGKVIIDTPILQLLQGAEISTATDSNGKGGEIELRTDELTLNNSKITAETLAQSTGDGGDIEINALITILENNSAIAVDSQGEGIGGNVELNTNQLTLNNSEITATTLSTDGGYITINAQERITLINSSNLTTTAGTEQAGGDGGDITLNTPFIFSIPANPINSITANAFTGIGGNIEITTNTIFGGEFLEISASSQLGVDGEVIINDPEIDPSSGLVIIDANFVDVASLIAQNPCANIDVTQGERGKFLIVGKGGLPRQSDDLLESNLILTPWLDFSAQIPITLNHANIKIPSTSQVINTLSSDLCRSSD